MPKLILLKDDKSVVEIKAEEKKPILKLILLKDDKSVVEIKAEEKKPVLKLIAKCGRVKCDSCENKKFQKCYNKSFISHLRVKDWSKINTKNPRDLDKSSKDKFFFDCDKCAHVFESSLCNMSYHKGVCLFCSNRKLCNSENCLDCYNKSFASHRRSINWSTENKVNPRSIFKGNTTKFIFNCDACPHSFEVTPGHIVHSDSWCPFCSSGILCCDENCIQCYNKSFASHPRSINWSEENKSNPRSVFKNTAEKYKFNCDKCSHNFEASLGHITNSESWCPFCSSKLLCYAKNCIECNDKSFASSDKVKYFSKKNIEDPRFIFKSSEKIYIFDCPYCNQEYMCRPISIAKGKWCGCTIQKTEALLYQWLIDNFNFAITKQAKFDWSKNITYLPFDFCIEINKKIVELDGLQHYRQVSSWKSPEETQKIDKYKMNCANANGYSVIRIFQPDVWNNKNDWQNKLREAIIKECDTPQNIFIGEMYQNIPLYHQTIDIQL